jgi:glycosyltransferase involved in cell wall biosynthesis
MSYSSEPSVLILMGTFNGEKYIREQLDSIAAQSHKNWRLVISDDGSTDKTLEIARLWAAEVGEKRVEFRNGPRRGFALNFLSMLCDENLIADFYAFCDQDDVWLPEKLSAGLAHLTRDSDLNRPSLYCGRTIYVTETLKNLGLSPLFDKEPSFKNALVQSLAGGNTMIVNHPAASLLRVARDLSDVVSHDWWGYIVVSGCGGKIYYDSQPHILYRQHHANKIGKNNSWGARTKRVKLIFLGKFREWHDKHFLALQAFNSQLSIENQKTLEKFKLTRIERNAVKRFVKLNRCGAYRQTFLGNVGLYVAAFFGKL